MEYTGEIKVKARRGRLPSEIADAQVEDDAPIIAVEEEEEADVVEADAETVSLDEIAEDEDDDDDDAAIVLDEEDLVIDDLDDDDIDDDDIEEDIAEDDDK